ncbi:MAG TPA: hypothetical protein VNV66_02865 [Pilimelia sp.]|nr:hypothetical protein [Pilimelia sp.]
MLTRLVGEPLPAYAARVLFAPLGIRRWYWPRDPDGLAYGFAHLRLDTAALAALGQLWLSGGRWRGVPLLDSGFAAEMYEPYTAGGWPEQAPYGHGFWRDAHGPFAGGWAGQHVMLVPAAGAVVVTTGDPRFDPGPPPTDRLPPDWRPARELVTARLVPALLAAG